MCAYCKRIDDEIARYRLFRCRINDQPTLDGITSLILNWKLRSRPCTPASKVMPVSCATHLRSRPVGAVTLNRRASGVDDLAVFAEPEMRPNGFPVMVPVVERNASRGRQQCVDLENGRA